MGAVVFVDGALQNSCVFHPNIFDLWLDDTVISPRVGFAHCCHGYIQPFPLLVTDTYTTLFSLSLIHAAHYSPYQYQQYMHPFTLVVTNTYTPLLSLSLIHTTLYSHCHQYIQHYSHCHRHIRHFTLLDQKHHMQNFQTDKY